MAFNYDEKAEEKLYQSMVRQAAYGQGVLNHNLSLFEKRSVEYAKSLSNLLDNYKSSQQMGELTGGEINKLLRQFDKAQKEQYKVIVDKAIIDLKDVMSYQRKGTQIIQASLLEGIDRRRRRDVPDADAAASRIRREVRETGRKGLYGNSIAHGSGDDADAALWAKIEGVVNPASGLSLNEQFDLLSRQINEKTLNLIRQGQANNWSIDELREALIGNETPLGQASLIRSVRNSYNSTLPTVQAQVSEQTNAAINSALLNYFQWVSVLDSSTTEICTHRADRIYEYGKDPLPPAHYRCRSTVFPRSTTRGGRVDESESFGDWVVDQPPIIQDDLLTPSVAKNLRDGKIGNERRRRLQVLAKLYPQALEEKAGLMI